MKNEMTIEELALQIGRCPNFVQALNGEQNSCKEIVDSQFKEHEGGQFLTISKKSVFHTPEPWAGNLQSAKIMFLSSNPSIDSMEIFPNLTWPEPEMLDFYLNRFSSDPNRKYGATEGSNIKEFDRTILSSGISPKRVKTWKVLRDRAAVLLEKQPEQTSATSDYVMTEVVHCKSKKEVGVNSALSVCVSKWFESILTLSAAKLIIVSGDRAGVAAKTALSTLSKGHVELGEFWGSWKRKPKAMGKWPILNSQLSEWHAKGIWDRKEQMNHIEVKRLSLNGREREFCFVWMPHPARWQTPQRFGDPALYSSEVLRYLRDYLK